MDNVKEFLQLEFPASLVFKQNNVLSASAEGSPGSKTFQAGSKHNLALNSNCCFSVLSALNICQENEQLYERLLLPVVHILDPELAHRIGVKICKYGMLLKSRFKDPTSLGTHVWQLAFENPVGIAAGFDKQGEAINGLDKIGFGFIEIGSVTPKPQKGNDKPRVFRLAASKAIINRYGFNSDGHNTVLNRIKKLRSDGKFTKILGVNLGCNKNSANPVNDYIEGVEKFGPLADYLVINISSPNTPGLREYQEKDKLQTLLSMVVTARNYMNCDHKPPLLLKLSPDLSDEDQRGISEIILNTEYQVDGLIISNTTTKRNPELKGVHVHEAGGLSGDPLRNVSTELISNMYQLTKGKLPIIGVGGIFTGQDAYDKIKAGASLIQLYTSFVYHGPPRISRIKQELDMLLKTDGFTSISEAVGKSLSKTWN